MSNLINAILVDDEQDSLITIQEQFKMYCPEIRILGCYSDAEQGLEKILQLRPDVAFLDIQMPKLNGLELAKRISTIGVKVVFITAYDKYAIDAIKLSALDFLLKPIQEPEELRGVVEKVMHVQNQQIQLPVFEELLANERTDNYLQDTQIGLADENGVYFFKINEIIRLKAHRNCCEFIFTEGRSMLVTKNLGTFVEALHKYKLVQVNRSEIINLRHRQKLVKKGGPYLVMSDGAKVMVSNNYKENLPYYNRTANSLFTLFFRKA